MHILNIDLFEVHISLMKLQVIQHYFTSFVITVLDFFRCLLEMFCSSFEKYAIYILNCVCSRKLVTNPKMPAQLNRDLVS